MPGTLIESRAIPQRRTGSSVASLLIHGALIAGGVAATAKDVVVTAAEPPIAHATRYVRPMNPAPVARAENHPASSTVASLPAFPRLDVPTVIPVGIPPIDMSNPATPVTFASGPIGQPGIFCDRECGAGPASDAAGHPLWGANDVMMRLLQDPVPPRYPESLRRAGIEGEVVVKFVVDTTGRIDQRTIEVLRSTHEAFTAAVREALAKMRFAPATSGERKLRALAIMPFRFALR